VNEGETNVKQLIEKLRCEDASERLRAREQIIASGDSAVEFLLELLDEQQQHARWEAAKALAGIAHPSAAPALVERLDDESPDVGWVAAEALIAIGESSMEVLVRKLVVGPSAKQLYKGAHHVLRDLHKRGCTVDLTGLLEAMRHQEPEIAVPTAAEAVLVKLSS
jgi:HEAT repeat protein